MRSVCVDVAVAASISDAVLPTAVDACARVERELTEAIRDSGLPVRPDVAFRTVAVGDLRGQPLRVTVDGRPCLVPAEVAADALAYANRAFPAESVWRSAMAVLAPEVRHEALALMVRAAVAAHPEVLVPPDDPLAALLRHGISVAGEDLDALRDRIRNSGVGAELDRLASPTVDLLIEPAYLRALTAEADGGELFAFMRDGLFAELGFGLPPMRVCSSPTCRTEGSPSGSTRPARCRALASRRTLSSSTTPWSGCTSFRSRGSQRSTPGRPSRVRWSTATRRTRSSRRA